MFFFRNIDKNSIEDDGSLGSAYEYKLESLYDETLKLNRKIRRIDDSKDGKKERLKGYYRELGDKEKEILMTVKNKLFTRNFI